MTTDMVAIPQDDHLQLVRNAAFYERQADLLQDKNSLLDLRIQELEEQSCDWCGDRSVEKYQYGFEVDGLRSQVADQEAEIAELQRRLQAPQAERDAAVKRAQYAEAELADAEARRQQAVKALREYSETNKHFSQQLADAKQRIAELEAELEMFKNTPNIAVAEDMSHLLVEDTSVLGRALVADADVAPLHEIEAAVYSTEARNPQ